VFNASSLTFRTLAEQGSNSTGCPLGITICSASQLLLELNFIFTTALAKEATVRAHRLHQAHPYSTDRRKARWSEEWYALIVGT